MTDEELLAQFETASIPADRFHHAEHVRIAFVYLCRYPLLEALGKFSASLKRLAAAAGEPDRYHETITWTYFFLVHERLGHESWEMFARNNPDLLDWERPILNKYYSREKLASARARRGFVMPDQLEGNAGVDAGLLRLA